MAIEVEDLQEKRQVLAGNIRARMGWLGISRMGLVELTGIPRRTLFDRLEGRGPFKDDQLWRIAVALGLDSPAALYEVPAGFPPPPAPVAAKTVRKRGDGLLPCTYGQLCWSEGINSPSLVDRLAA